MNEYKNKSCLVTGGTGLIGRQVVDLLVEYGAKVESISFDALKINPNVSYHWTDLTNSVDCYSMIGEVKWDYVFHIAGIKASPKITLERPATMAIPALQVNTNVLEACRINGIKNVLFTSSIGAYAEAETLKEENSYLGEPMDSAPGHVKRLAERQIQWYQKEYGLTYKCVRLSNVWGVGDNFNPDNAMFIPSLMAKVLRGDNPVELWGDGSNIRDYVYSKDVAQGILQMMLKSPDCYPINLAGLTAYSVKDVVECLQGIAKFNYSFNNQPSGVQKRVMDISKAQSLGYCPMTSLYNGLKETWEWYKEHPQEHLRRLNYFDHK